MPEEILAAQAKIVSSSGFQNSDRMVRFLRFVVEKTLAGDQDQLKEYLLGVEVFDRPESFDPKVDTIVRVEARRLRKKLKEYYDADGAADTVRIEVPPPGYVPVFSKLLTEEPVVVPRKIAGWVWVAVGVVVLAGVVFGIARRAGASKIDSIAVLPFSDMSEARDQEYFCDGFTEELISALASTEGLRVVARTSAFAFKGKAGDIREIARKLDAGAILEGSVRRSGGTARITAQLIRASDGYHLWSKSYDRRLEDVLVVQQEIAGLIAATLQKQLVTVERPKALNLEAHDLYLLGRYHWNRFDQGDLEKAVGYFEKAIALDPSSAQAYSGLSDAYSYMIDGDMAPTGEILPKARAAADKALELDPNSAEAHTARGLVAHELEWDQARAKKEFLRALELKPSYAYGIHWYSHFLEWEGKMDEAAEQMGRALAIDPLARLYTIDLAMIRYKQRRYDQALKGVDKAAELDPDYFLLDSSRGLIYEAQKDWPRALARFRKARDKMPGDPTALGFLAQVEALSGNKAEARELLAEMRAASAKAYVPDYLVALVEFALEDVAEGRAALKRAIAGHSGMLVWMRSTPLFDRARADAEGKALLESVGGF
jgi:TolB-like protein/Tfp pilus assembly protein PilF